MYGIDYEYGILILQQEAQRLRVLVHRAASLYTGSTSCRQYSDRQEKLRDLAECLELLEKFQYAKKEGK